MPNYSKIRRVTMKHLYFAIVFFVFNSSWAQSIWQGAGLLSNTFNQTDVCFNVDSYSGTDDEKVADALSAAKNYVLTTQGRAMIYFSGRTYNLTHSIKLGVGWVSNPPNFCLIFKHKI